MESRIRALNSRLGKWPGNSNAVTNVALENERIRVPVINRNVDVVTPSLQQQKYKCGMVIMIVTISLEVVYSCYLNMQVFESGFTLKNTCSLVYNVLASTGFPLQIGLLFVPLIFLYPRRPLTWLFYILSIGCQVFLSVYLSFKLHKIFIYIFHKLFASEDTQEVFSDFHAFFCGFCFFLGLFFFMFWAAHPTSLKLCKNLL